MAISSAWRARPAKTGSVASDTAAEATGRGMIARVPVTAASTTATGLSRFEDRGPCTDAERRAAAWLHDDLRANGHEAWVETHWVRPQWALSLALHATFGVVASLLAIATPLPAAILAAVAALSMAVEANGRRGPLRFLFPGGRPRTCSSCQTRRGAGRHAADLRALRRAARRAHHARRPAAAGGAAAPPPRRPCARPAGVGGARAGGDRRVRRAARAGHRGRLARSRAVRADDHATRRARRGGRHRRLPLSPGAGDNAAGVGVAVALHAELTRNPPGALAPALLLYGAGEGGPPAVRAHLRREKLARERVVVLDLGPCGAGAPAYATAHPQLRAACRRAAEALDGAARAPLRRSSAAAAARGRRLPTAWIGALDATGIAPRSRQPSDTLEHLDPAAGEAVLDFALACVDALDADLAP